MSAYELVQRHVEAAVAEAAGQSIGADVVARNLVYEAVRLFKAGGRSIEDIAAELTSTAENLDEDEAIGFMRP
jgi:hypothetical protein